MDRTFSETLIAEWLQINDWSVRTGVPLEAKKSGGRDEADIVGIKFVDNLPKLLHIEVGSLGNSAKGNLDTLEKKFDNKKGILQKEFGVENCEVEQWYIATYLSSDIEKLRAKNYKVDMLHDVIQKQILPDIFTWKLRKSEGRKTPQLPTPPNNLWFVQFLDYMAIWGVDLSPYWGIKNKKTKHWELAEGGVKIYKKNKIQHALHSL